MNAHRLAALVASIFFGTATNVAVAAESAVTAPLVQYFAKRGGTTLKAIVYRPEGWRSRDARPAVVIFNSLGWTAGQPEWGESYAKHYASLGLISICPEFRLANASLTPLDSMADARDAIRWIRANAAALGIDPMRIAVHGLSTGGQLALAAAISPGTARPSAAPNALILYSPALDLENDARIQPLLGDKASAASISPLLGVREGLPPTFIVQGDVDTVTPHPSAKLFCSKMTELGNRCELNTYMYMGHLLTPKAMRDDQTPKPEPKVAAAALEKVDEFLASLGYLNK